MEKSKHESSNRLLVSPVRFACSAGSVPNPVQVPPVRFERLVPLVQVRNRLVKRIRVRSSERDAASHVERATFFGTVDCSTGSFTVKLPAHFFPLAERLARTAAGSFFL